MKVKCACCKKLIQKKDGIKVTIFYDEDYKLEISKYYCQECNRKQEEDNEN